MSGCTSNRLLSMPNPPLRTLRDCSYDSDNNMYLVDCEDMAICCDEVVEQYNARVGGIREPPLSVDAIFIGVDGRCMFVEFKNKPLDQRLSYEVRHKAYDTLLILGDLQGVRIGETRLDSDLVLVYSAGKTTAKHEGSHDSRTEVSHSESFTRFGETMARMANTHFIERGMGTLKGYCFSDVHTCTEEQFRELVVNSGESLLGCDD